LTKRWMETNEKIAALPDGEIDYVYNSVPTE
jgi:hypothetical protein